MGLAGRLTLIFSLAVATVACATRKPAVTEQATPAAASLDRCAARYVKLGLALGQHDANYVDAYYGPPAWAAQAKATNVSLAEIESQAAALVRELAAVPVPADPLVALPSRRWSGCCAARRWRSTTRARRCTTRAPRATTTRTSWPYRPSWSACCRVRGRWPTGSSAFASSSSFHRTGSTS